ncbi:hypothetical protein CPC08DRAFT_754972 [Agrocybe pediades]|nr:hypothetical protein CPC08DRAFT_754972 [Agrocybe pediades]
MPDGSAFTTFPEINATIPVACGHSDIYNCLTCIRCATNLLFDQIKTAGTTQEELFTKIARLFFSHGYQDHLALSLLHRHVILQEGERLVSVSHLKDDIEHPPHEPVSTSSPSTAHTNTFPERWLRDGTELEYVRVPSGDSAMTPSTRFFSDFQSILGPYITVLGICHIPPMERLAEGKIFVERSSRTEERTQVTWIEDDNPEDALTAIWVAERRPTSVSFAATQQQDAPLMEALRGCASCKVPDPGCLGMGSTAQGETLSLIDCSECPRLAD